MLLLLSIQLLHLAVHLRHHRSVAVPFLPIMKGNVVDSRDRSDRFLWDLRRLIADKVSYDYVGGLREVCNKNGVTVFLSCISPTN